jgi:pimeloyl-[acyl-carrier protein] methyl ester esterase
LPYFAAPDGAQIAYEDFGTGRPLLLLHGLMAHREFFQFQNPLADEFRLISLDLRGHGQSRRKDEPVTIEQMVDDVAAFVEALDLHDAIGVGWSLGAVVLWGLLAGREANRFAGAVIVDMTPKVVNDGDWDLGLTEELCEARRVAIRDDFEAFATAAGHAIFAQPLDARAEGLAPWSGTEFARNDSATMSVLWDSLAGQDFRPALAEIGQPALIIHGAQSQLYRPGTADYLVTAMPHARALAFARSGHAPHIEQPDLFNTTIRDFAASLPRGPQYQNTH